MPRQITTFEFKLIGFMTLRQFGYVLLGGVVGYLIFLIVQVQIINVIVGVLVGSVGLIFAFVPVNDRPLDVFIRNLVKRLNSPTQYIFHKQNPPLAIFQELYFNANPHVTLAHVESVQKLEAYLKSTRTITVSARDGAHQDRIVKLFQSKQSTAPPKVAPIAVPAAAKHTARKDLPQPPPPPQDMVLKHPVLTGITYNRRHIPLPGVLLYIKDPQSSQTVRILKTNPHGVFATFHPLTDGEYRVEIVDPAGNYVFDPATLSVSGGSHTNLEYVSKETI